jgi:hypothetical protein
MEKLLPILLIAFGGGILALIVVVVLLVRRSDKRIVAGVTALLQQGMPANHVERHLIAQRLPPDQAASLVRRAVEEIAERTYVSIATELIRGGVSEEETRKQLVAKGLNRETATNVVQHVVQEPWSRKRPVLSKVLGISIGVPLTLAGGVVIFFGLAVADWNQRGEIAAFPFAGYLTQLLGLMILVFGLALVVLPFYKPSALRGPE